MEPIKQEIINNIFENGDKLITGPILQTVLIDMIDDVNVKDQEILSKTGSWDDAATQIPNLATKAEVTNLSESVARDLENVVDVDLTGYATEQWVESQGYLKEHQDISNLATKTELNDTKNNLQGNITSLSESVARDLANVSVPEGVATEAWVQSQDYANKTYVNEAVSSSAVDLTGYATETWVQNQGYLKEHQDISNLATKSELNSVSESVQTDITSLSESVANSAVWKKGTGTDSIVQIIADGTYLPTATGRRAVATGYYTTASGGASHAEGEGTKALGAYDHAEGFGTTASGSHNHAEGQNTTASGRGSHAEGSSTIASAHCSHAEGGDTKASGSYSHAEGIYTVALGQASHTEGFRTTASKEGSHAEGESTIASGSYSHAEGGYTTTSNQYEHAQGQYNHNSTNQIFSVGAGEKIGETVTRRNAVSILEVPNSDTQVVTASFFVQNIGGYDGTNPEPGTNDLATVINGLSSGGGSSETLWKKGEGQDSIAQIITTDNIYIQPKATGTGSIATGYYTEASGSWSHAEGSNTLASGDNSHAEGSSTNASGEASHAEGNYTKALGKFGSHAEGRGTEASGWGSHAEGHNTVASEQYSHAEGSSTVASGFYGHAEGSSTVASGFASHAEGAYTTASGGYSHAEGYGTKASGYYSHAEGNYTTASGQYSHAEGYQTIASNRFEHAQGQYNHSSTNQIFSVGAGDSIKDPDTQVVTETRRNAISVLAVDNSGSYTSSFFVQNVGGYDGTNPEPGTNDLATVINGLSSSGGSSSGGSSETLWKKGTGTDSIVQVIDGTYPPEATGTGSIATGYSTKASGSYSHTEGEGTKTTGEASHAEGWYTKALGNSSHAEGNYTIASGSNSHAEGSYTTASGDYSHAEGFYTKASNTYEHAQGLWNHTSPNQIFSVGAGEKINYVDTRRNAISVLAVPNADSKILTASFFVQNVGGYDGTNPTPGTNDLATVINSLSSGGGSSETLWKKGEGEDSIVQIIADGTSFPIAPGKRAIATGMSTNASGYCSHAEGQGTKAEGLASYAEGRYTNASGDASHAEGLYTTASNEYEHAQGRYNHSSTNQIFSIGTGNSDTDRRNAVSVLEVSNNNSYTSSFFVQNIGGYDGTNPTPGTNDLATVINNLPSGGGSSETIWKKGTGTDSIVQVIADGTNLPTATGNRAIATGYRTTASGSWSHAEGEHTIASGNCSHAEGSYSEASGPYSHAEGEHTTTSGYCSHTEGMGTTTSGMYSHAEGRNTKTSNIYEHAQGRYNHNSENQIFSIGTGNSETDRRNAVSVLEVDNNNSYTSSFFVQNVGGYDGTNPEPGTNDLATVLNNTETWTFTLEDGSTVTKTIRIV